MSQPPNFRQIVRDCPEEVRACLTLAYQRGIEVGQAALAERLYLRAVDGDAKAEAIVDVATMFGQPVQLIVAFEGNASQLVPEERAEAVVRLVNHALAQAVAGGVSRLRLQLALVKLGRAGLVSLSEQAKILGKMAARQAA